MNKSYAICYNSLIANSKEVMETLRSLLVKNGICADVFDVDDLKQGYDFVFVVGGDGTILKAARFYSKDETPIFGINLGRLGFLSQASIEDLDNAVNSILATDYKIEQRMMLECGSNNALNDFVIKGESSSRTSKFILHINDNFVCEYMADGIIVSTPTGSTAYSMAAGGPILAPEVEAITIVPICPHTFSARPIVVSSDDEIRILPAENHQYKVAADGQVVFFTSQDLLIKKSSKKASLALLNKNDFYSVMRNKLNWGYSPAKC